MNCHLLSTAFLSLFALTVSSACVSQGLDDSNTQACLEERAECSWSRVVCDLGEGVDFYKAELTGADMEGADLRCADLRGADLTGVDLDGANLEGADLRGATLTGVDMNRANLQHVDLRCADLTGADLNNVDLRKANIAGVDMTGVDMEGALTAGMVRNDEPYRPTYSTQQTPQENGESKVDDTAPSSEEDRVAEPDRGGEEEVPEEVPSSPESACY